MPSTVWIDGKWYDRGTAVVSVFDHGLLYGDGVFEGIRAYGGRVFRLADHVDRLYASAKAIWLEVPVGKPEMVRVVEEGVARRGLKDAYIRLLGTRGARGWATPGRAPRKCPKASVICITDRIRLWSADRYEQGLTAVTAATPINHRESLSPRIKSLNYLTHILAQLEGLTAAV